MSNKRASCAAYGRERAAYRHRKGAAMTVLVEPFASVYDDRSRLGIILARGKRGFEAYVADDYSLGLHRGQSREPGVYAHGRRQRSRPSLRVLRDAA